MVYQPSGQIIIFHQPRFPWNEGISLTKPPFEVRSCEVAMIWPEPYQLVQDFVHQRMTCFLSAQRPLEPQVAYPNNQGILISFKPLKISLIYMGVSKNRGTPKWMVYNGKPYEQMDDFGGRKPTIFGNIHIDTSFNTKKTPVIWIKELLSHTIHVWHIYLHLP